MLAYHNDPSIKAFYLDRVRGHRAAGDLIKGRYWTGSKGCAIGCTVHGDSHSAYEWELGIPQVLAALKEIIFEGLPLSSALNWPVSFLEAIPVGADLSGVWSQFALYLLAGPHGAITFARTTEQRRIIEDAIVCHERGAAFLRPPAEWTVGIYPSTALTADIAAAYTALVSNAAVAAVYAATAIAAAGHTLRYAATMQQAHARQADRLYALLLSAPVPTVLDLRARQLVRV